ncbi:MAG: YitT family protein, partial [Clostridia bacterium]
MKPRKWKEVGFYLGANLVGSVLYGVGILCFTTPHHIAPGGAGGIAALVHYFTGFPIGLFLFLFTVPLLLIGGRYLG